MSASTSTKEIHCNCGKLLLKITPSGKIRVWCKSCRKEIDVEVEPHEPEKSKLDSCKSEEAAMGS